jgi:hypothetical protein
MSEYLSSLMNLLFMIGFLSRKADLSKKKYPGAGAPGYGVPHRDGMLRRSP